MALSPDLNLAPFGQKPTALQTVRDVRSLADLLSAASFGFGFFGGSGCLAGRLLGLFFNPTRQHLWSHALRFSQACRQRYLPLGNFPVAMGNSFGASGADCRSTGKYQQLPDLMSILRGLSTRQSFQERQHSSFL